MLSFCRPLPIFVEWPAEKKYTSDNIWRHGEFTISKIASDKVRRSCECSVPNHQMCRNPEHNGIIAEQPVASGSCDECIDGHEKKEVNGYNKWGSNQCNEVVKQDRRGNCQIGGYTVDLKQLAKSTAADSFKAAAFCSNPDTLSLAAMTSMLWQHSTCDRTGIRPPKCGRILRHFGGVAWIRLL